MTGAYGPGLLAGAAARASWTRERVNGYWFEIAVVATIFAVGNVLFGHFEEGTAKWRRVLKLFLTIGLGVAISSYLGRPWFWGFLLAMVLPAVYIHGWWLPSKGVNGWTGEPKERYYELRGWKARK